MVCIFRRRNYHANMKSVGAQYFDNMEGGKE